MQCQEFYEYFCPALPSASVEACIANGEEVCMNENGNQGNAYGKGKGKGNGQGNEKRRFLY